ncbi:hypothetical protein FACS1894140_0140 [Spirochaetia bacterium]|nr:hypothetical protein FACS1894140_0140 [Spirochaetia bacterium]
MTEYSYDGSLEGLFSILDEIREAKVCRTAVIPGYIRYTRCSSPLDQGGLFGDDGGVIPSAGRGEAAGLFCTVEPAVSPLTGSARDLYAVSANTFDAFVYAWMSELPVEAEIVRFGWKALAAAKEAVGAAGKFASDAAGGTAPADWTACEEARLGAEKAACDRGDPDVRAVLATAYKVAHEIDRMRGFLRFSPDVNGVYTARCTPDHFVLPALAPHFTRRFGEQGWAIIDEKRHICLLRRPGRLPELLDLPPSLAAPSSIRSNDEWGSLWRHYHRTINNESRKNPLLQRQFMPERYWKYLPELNTKTV